jgi:HAE1 family hydrophobic/amphiphilic exporter-1
MLSAYWADPHKLPHERGWITRQLDKFNEWFNRQAVNYKKVIAWALDHRAAMVATATLSFFASFFLAGSGLNALGLAVVGIVLIVIGLSADRLHGAVRGVSVLAGAAVFLLTGASAFAGKPFALKSVGKVGTAFFPEDDRAEFIMAIETPPGSNMEYTRLKAAEAANIAKTHPEVTYTYTTLGNQATGGVDEGNIYVRLVPKSERHLSVEKLAEELRHETGRMSGATVSVFTSDFNAGFKAIQLQLRGQDVAALALAADQVKAEVQKIPGAVDIGLSTKGLKPELEIDLNRGVAGTLGLTVGQVAQSLRPAFAGIDAGYWIDPSGKSRKVTVRLTPESRQRAADLERLPMVVQGPNGVPTTMPLGQIASIRSGVGPAIIDHLNREPVVTVEMNTSGRAAGDITAEIKQRLDKMRLPAGVRYTIGGDAESQAEVFGQIFSALGLAVLLMYLILVVQFGSFIDPVAILMSLPLSLIGVMLALSITGMTINIMSLIGVILLMGIVAKNAILLIDFAKWAREERGVPLREALIEAGAIRLRPILMTTFALIAGMIPVALGRGEGAQFRAPLGVAVIGGVITSTFLTLLVIPTGYEILDEWRHAFMRMMGATPKQMTAEHPVPTAGD